METGLKFWKFFLGYVVFYAEKRFGLLGVNSFLSKVRGKQENCLKSKKERVGTT